MQQELKLLLVFIFVSTILISSIAGSSSNVFAVCKNYPNCGPEDEPQQSKFKKMESPIIPHFKNSYEIRDIIKQGKVIIVSVDEVKDAWAKCATSPLTCLDALEKTGASFRAIEEVHGKYIGRGEDLVNPGVKFQGPNCKITNVLLNSYNKEGGMLDYQSKQVRGTQGVGLENYAYAKILESHEGTNNAETKVSWYFPAGTAIRYSVIYEYTGNCHE